MPPRRVVKRGIALLALATGASVAAAGCSSGSEVAVVTTSTVTAVRSSTNSGPVSTATVDERPTPACPYIATDIASSDVGFRLDRVTLLIQDRRTVGCRFYALQQPTDQCDQACLDHERLPPGTVPGIEILATRYATPVDAHNAFVRTALAGRNHQQVAIEPGNTGVCYQTTVWAHDDGTDWADWACAFSKNVTAVVIRTVVTDPALNVVELAKTVAPKF